MDRGAWWAAVHGVTKSGTRLSDFTFTFHFHALEKEMATHSSVLAWRIPGTEEPGRRPSMGLHSQTRLKQLSSSSSREKGEYSRRWRWGTENSTNYFLHGFLTCLLPLVWSPHTSHSTLPKTHIWSFLDPTEICPHFLIVLRIKFQLSSTGYKS